MWTCGKLLKNLYYDRIYKKGGLWGYLTLEKHQIIAQTIKIIHRRLLYYAPKDLSI